MSDIIDLDFYRKFRVVLPVHPLPKAKNKAERGKVATTKVYRRRRKLNPKASSTTKKNTPS